MSNLRSRRCVYGNCENLARDENEHTFFCVPFPKAMTARTFSRLEKWVKACGRKSLTVTDIQDDPQKYFICSKHFVGGDGPNNVNPDPISFVPVAEPLKVQLFKPKKKDSAEETKKDSAEILEEESAEIMKEIKQEVIEESGEGTSEVADTITEEKRMFRPKAKKGTKGYTTVKSKSSNLKARKEAVVHKAPPKQKELKKYCSVAGCNSVSPGDYTIQLYPFPSDATQLNLWREALKFGDDPPKNRAFVCSKHFLSGLMSSLPKHPDYVPSIFPSTSASRIKFLRGVLRRFEEQDYNRRKLLLCESVQEKLHNRFNDYTKEEIEKDVHRIRKNVKRKRRRQEQKSSKKRLAETVVKAEPHDSDVEPEVHFEIETDRAEEEQNFVIENERAEDVSKRDEDGFDLSKVKDEPMSDEEVHSNNKPSAASSKDLPRKPQTAKRTKKLKPQSKFKSEPMDAEYDKALNSEDCDEMLTVHFGGTDGDKTEENTDEDVPNYESYPPASQGIPSTSSGYINTQAFGPPAPNMNLPFILPIQGQKQVFNIGSQSFPPFQHQHQVVYAQPGQNLPLPAFQPSMVNFKPSAPKPNPDKIVFALDPNTYQNPVTGQNTFVVPKENIINLSLDDEKEKIGDIQGSTPVKSNTFSKAEEMKLLYEQYEQKGKTSTVYSEPESEIESSDQEEDTVQSSDYVPSSDDYSGDERARPSSRTSVVSDTLSTGSKKIAISTSPTEELEERTRSSGVSSRASSTSDLVLLEDPDETSAAAASKGKSSKKRNKGKVAKDLVSQECQTDPSISKEVAMENQLKKLGYRLTPEQMKEALKQPLYVNGNLATLRNARTPCMDVAVLNILDTYFIADLRFQTEKLAKEVEDQKRRYEMLGYNFEKNKSTKHAVTHHTGCYTKQTLTDLFKYVSICVDSPPIDQDMSQYQEFILTLMKFRLGLINVDLAFRFEILPNLVPEILSKWVGIFTNTLCPLMEWPEQEPEKTEHRNQRWRLLKLRYYLLQAYDGIDSKKDRWLLEQDMDEIIRICDALNSFVVKDSENEDTPEVEEYVPEPVEYFVERMVYGHSGKETPFDEIIDSNRDTAVEARDDASSCSTKDLLDSSSGRSVTECASESSMTQKPSGEIETVKGKDNDNASEDSTAHENGNQHQCDVSSVISANPDKVSRSPTPIDEPTNEASQGAEACKSPYDELTVENDPETASSDRSESMDVDQDQAGDKSDVKPESSSSVSPVDNMAKEGPMEEPTDSCGESATQDDDEEPTEHRLVFVDDPDGVMIGPPVVEVEIEHVENRSFDFAMRLHASKEFKRTLLNPQYC